MRFKFASLLAVAFSLGFAQAASAADMPVKAPIVKAPAVAPFSWTGFYIGANIGGAWNRSGWADSLGAAPAFNVNGSSVIGGGQVGYNYQMGQWVLGVEAALDGLNINASNQCSTTVGSVCNTKQNTLGSITGRFGYAGMNRALVYATGGAAFTRYSYAETQLLIQSWGSSTRTGWTIGGGVEYAVTNNWIVGIQYNYYDFGTQTLGGGSNPVNVNFRETESAVTGRLSYKF